MPQILRVETQSGGPQGSVPFLWTSGPRGGGGRVIDSLAKVEPVDLALVKGTRQQTPSRTEGRVMDTFRVWAKNGDNVKAQAAASRLGQMFELAESLDESGSMADVVYMFDQVKDEVSIRRATVYGGSITRMDHEIVSVDMATNKAFFVVVVERDENWEFGETVSTKKQIGDSVGTAAGSLVLPTTFASIGGVGRIPLFMVRPFSAQRIKRAWYGIKPNRTGITSFDAYVRIGSDSYAPVMDTDTVSVTDVGAYGGMAKKTVFKTKKDWTTRFRCPITGWNQAVTGTEANRQHYVGKYHFLVRYKIIGDPDALVGVRVGTGWAPPANITWGKREWLSQRANDDGTSIYSWIDLGVISVGGDSWDYVARQRMLLEAFNIYIEQKLGTGASGHMYMDVGALVPADHFVHFSLSSSVTGDRRVEIHTDDKNNVRGYVVAADNKDPFGLFSINRKVYEGISDITSSNWGMPWEESPFLVQVCDNGDIEEKLTTDTNWLYMTSAKRTKGFAYNPNG